MTEDRPEYDATDAAHPAWWRGHDHAERKLRERLDELLDRLEVVDHEHEVTKGYRQHAEQQAERLMGEVARLSFELGKAHGELEGWLGFDCAHGGDLVPSHIVRAEVERLAMQVRAAC